ncbi:hypothetical protein BGW36DRAFT_390971 [Talaromyces proteolyticus]|uniref:Uncharacterized protein n=1 Tax=Talaromyces proteolyticus TaxID=1131652 RepID=A0AAD4KIU5_9EURO|nr:uncharacterized protein BGW36DRAFT_390971 [Talaromyces proteolyticus]KAH8689510.1 hypothetical protein BGW36DRAFT_390971 [Talaromyces proteolyticus]
MKAIIASKMPPSDVFWVDSRGDKHSAKHAFIKRNSHRLKREKKLYELRRSIQPFCLTNMASRAHSDPVELAEEHDYQELRHPLVVPSISRDFDPGFLDSFSSLPTPVTREMNFYFNYYKSTCSKSCYPFNYNEMGMWWWQKAIDQPALVYIILATCALHRAGITLDSASTEATQKFVWHSLKFRQQTIQSLQQLIHQTPKYGLEMVVLVVINMICVEGADANMETIDVHMEGLRKFVYLLGGLENLDHLTVSGIYCAEYMRCVSKNCLPFFPISTIWKHEVLEASKALKKSYNNQHLGRFGKRFSESSWSRGLQPGFKLILQNFKLIVFRCEGIFQGTATSMPMECDFLILWSHQLLSFLDETGAIGFQDTLRLALLTYSSIRIWNLDGCPCVQRLVDALRSSLERKLFILQRSAPDLLFWIYFIGAIASQKQGREHHEWFASGTIDAAKSLRLQEFDDLRLLLKEFCFICRPADKFVKDLWDMRLRASYLESNDKNPDE